jgi:serine/threonine protein phosphatase PrpC
VLVLASDGLWDAMNNDEATRLALEQRRRGAEAAARALVAEAYQRGSLDNISCVVVFLSLEPSRGGSRCSAARDASDSAVVTAAAAVPAGPT